MVSGIQPSRSLLEVLGDAWWIGVVALGISLVFTPLVRLIAYRSKIVDKPDDLLKPHGRPVAYLGGVAICLGLLAGLAAYLHVMPDVAQRWQQIRADLQNANYEGLLSNPLWKLMGLGFSSIIITVVGLLDDIYDITPRQKVMGQVLAAVALLCGGVGLRLSVALLVPLNVTLSFWPMAVSSSLIFVVLVIAACNATNLLDGLDGLCGGVTGIIALGFLALAAHLAMYRLPGPDDLRVVLCLAMAGAVFGFLPYNLPPASIFMGDAGSMLLGFFVAAMMGMFGQDGNPRWLQAAVVVFALPILDTALAVVRRLLAHKSIFIGDRSHLYDQLVDRGWTVKQVVGLFYFLAAATAAMGVMMAMFLRGWEAFWIYVVLLTLVCIFFWAKGMVAPPPREPAHHDEPSKLH